MWRFGLSPANPLGNKMENSWYPKLFELKISILCFTKSSIIWSNCYFDLHGASNKTKRKKINRAKSHSAPLSFLCTFLAYLTMLDEMTLISEDCTWHPNTVRFILSTIRIMTSAFLVNRLCLFTEVHKKMFLKVNNKTKKSRFARMREVTKIWCFFNESKVV